MYQPISQDVESGAPQPGSSGVGGGRGATGGGLLPRSTVSGLSLPPLPEPEDEDDIPLERLLLDAYEFHGLKELGLYFMFLAACVVFVWWQWPSDSAYFRSSVVESMKQFKTGESLQDVHSMMQAESAADGVEYTLSWLETTINSTEQRLSFDSAPQIVIINDNADLKLALLTVTLDPSASCKSGSQTARGASCSRQAWRSWREAACEQQAGQGAGRLRAEVEAFKTSGRWRPDDQNEHTWHVLLVSSNATDAALHGLQVSSASFKARVKDIQDEDMDVLTTYTQEAMLRTVVVDSEFGDVLFVETFFKQNNHPSIGQAQTGTMLVLTLYRGDAPWLVVVCVLALLLCLQMLRIELRTWWLCYCQTASRWLYFRFGWSVFQLTTVLITIGYLVSYIGIVFGDTWRGEECEDDIRTAALAQPGGIQGASEHKVGLLGVSELSQLRRHAQRYTLYMYVGIGVIALQGCGMLRYMRVHPGLKAFYQVFVVAFDTIKDFSVFVLYVFLVLGMVVFGMFHVSGGNPLFVNYGTGLGAMARLQFQLLEFEEFTNNNLGFGAFSGFMNLAFWVAVVLLVVFAANVLLAIFQSAYEAVKRRAVHVEYSFVWLVVLRVAFVGKQMGYHARIWWQEFMSLSSLPFGHPPKKDSAQKIPLTRPQIRRTGHTFAQGVHSRRPKMAWWYLNDIMGPYEKTESRMKDGAWHDVTHVPKGVQLRSWHVLQARWLVARKRTTYALAAWYTSYKDLRLIGPKEQPHWVGRERLEPQDLTRAMVALAGVEHKKTKRLKRHELRQLMEHIHDEWERKVKPPHPLLQWLMALPHFSRLTDAKADRLAGMIQRVYCHSSMPTRGLDDDEILEEEAEDPLEQQARLVKKVDRLAAQMEALMIAFQAHSP